MFQVAILTGDLPLDAVPINATGLAPGPLAILEGMVLALLFAMLLWFTWWLIYRHR